MVNYHHRLPLTGRSAPALLSSSDGQRFPVKGKSITARHLSRYFARGQGVSTYTHVSDQHSTFDTKVIVATAPESHYVLDGLLGNETDLPTFEHATDTHGATLANFALFDPVGKQLSPRIRDLGKITLYRTGPRADFLDRYPRTGPLLTRRLNLDLITDMWDDLLRVAASVQGGHATARPDRREAVFLQTAAERADQRDQGISGRYAARCLADETYRRRDRPAAQQGREPARPAPFLAYASEGALRRAASRAADRANVVPDPGHQRDRLLVHGVSRPRRGRSAPPRPPGRRRGAGAHPGRPTTRTCTSTAPTPSTSTANSPSLTPADTGSCGWPRPAGRASDRPHQSRRTCSADHYRPASWSAQHTLMHRSTQETGTVRTVGSPVLQRPGCGGC